MRFFFFLTSSRPNGHFEIIQQALRLFLAGREVVTLLSEHDMLNFFINYCSRNHSQISHRQFN
jgi:hypothetical protein